MADPGTLYVVATPIGNIDDLSRRAERTLRAVSLIACEDTRHTRKLLTAYGIDRPTVSFHAHSKRTKTDSVLARLLSGDDVALVTDAGTPGIADPGAALVAAARQVGLTVVPIPGPAAVTSALSASGLGADQFSFLGWLPHKKGRQKRLDGIPRLPQPVVVYESPHRLVKLLDECRKRFPEADLTVARELTKRHEEFRRGTPGRLHDWYRLHPPKGECVVIIAA